MRSYRNLPAGCRVAGRFAIESRLGLGRTSAVYAAVDTETDSRVALKVLDPMLATDPAAVERFARELKILRRVRHPNVIQVYDFLEEDGVPILCMELFDGTDCGTCISRRGPMTVKETIAIGRAVAAAIDACHRARVLHRDLKPQNVLVDERLDVKVVDFGMSKMTALADITMTGAMIGTPEYMAPEMFRTTRPDPRSDLYGIGALLYALLAGRPPHRGASLAAVMQSQMSEAIEPLSSLRADVPLWLHGLILRCLRVDPADRPQSSWEILRSLEKGEKTSASAVPKTVASCVHCEHDLIAGLPFCAGCGTFTQLRLDPGPFAVLLEGCDDTVRVRDLLSPDFNVAPRLSGLNRFPVVLVSGVSRGAAEAVAHHLGGAPCVLKITDRLAGRFDLPVAFALLGALLLLPLLWLTDTSSAIGVLAITAFAETSLYLLYQVRTQPLAQPRRQKSRSPGADPLARELAAEIRELRDAKLKDILGRIAAVTLRLHRSLAHTVSIFDPRSIAATVREAIRAAGRLESYEGYLARTGVADIRERMRAAVLAIERAGAEDLDRLIAAKAKLDEELTTYEELADLHGRIYVSLVNLLGVLQKIEETHEVAAARSAAADLREIDAELRDDGGAAGVEAELVAASA